MTQMTTANFTSYTADLQDACILWLHPNELTYRNGMILDGDGQLLELDLLNVYRLESAIFLTDSFSGHHPTMALKCQRFLQDVFDGRVTVPHVFTGQERNWTFEKLSNLARVLPKGVQR